MPQHKWLKLASTFQKIQNGDASYLFIYFFFAKKNIEKRFERIEEQVSRLKIRSLHSIHNVVRIRFVLVNTQE